MTLRIGLVSDTHLPRFGSRLPEMLRQGLLEPRVDLILHLGDFTGPDVPRLFEEIAPLEAVAGNNDGAELRARFGRRRVLELAGVRIGMVHGDEGSGRTTPERAWRAFAAERVDVIAFGHSHAPSLGRREEVVLLNPGSPTDKRREPHYSYALLELSGGRIEAALRFFGTRA